MTSASLRKLIQKQPSILFMLPAVLHSVTLRAPDTGITDLAHIAAQNDTQRIAHKSAARVTSHQQEPMDDIDPSLADALPIEWVHVPKCGSSFLVSLLHIRGVCTNEPELFSQSDMRVVNDASNPLTSWNCKASAIDLGRTLRAHGGIDAAPLGGFNAGKGHFMMMMRQPEQRLLSHWYYMHSKKTCCFSSFPLP